MRRRAIKSASITPFRFTQQNDMLSCMDTTEENYCWATTKKTVSIISGERGATPRASEIRHTNGRQLAQPGGINVH